VFISQVIDERDGMMSTSKKFLICPQEQPLTILPVKPSSSKSGGLSKKMIDVVYEISVSYSAAFFNMP
jgi:hypothetical protein